ncbi:histidine kinase/DNA gyrase B/HSP90-like ATPase [Chitinophaga skermanii]|uniref:histidine kinase n=1 Tax=Chitinophaga skermanii TaxID=331697 RepID=A0A327PYZ0_9BACT|nr:tetratricopeptide repeat-containing sensor histidine kinase [Chitinophaga skermanii]RAI97470.1 histidine kinase/DNA gyrase B/HSP90-like ATPase [Chitinophaga skermanii]
MKFISVIILLASCLLSTLPTLSQEQRITTQEPYVRVNPDSIAKVDQLNALAAHYYMHQLDTSFLYSKEAQAIAVRNGYERGEGMALHNIGVYYTLKNNWIAASHFYAQALRVFERINDTELTCLTHSDIGTSYLFYEGKQAEAQTYLAQAFQDGLHLEKDSVFAYVLANYYSIWKANPHMQDSANWAIQRAAQIGEKYHDTRIKSYVHLLQAGELFVNGKKQAACDLLQVVANTAIQNQQEYIAIQAYTSLYSNRLDMNDPQAIQFFKKAYDLGMKAGYRELMVDAVDTLFNYYDRQGNIPEALKYAREMMQLNDSQKLSKHASDEHYIDHLLVETTVRNQSLSTSNRRLIVTILGILFISIIIIAYIFYRSYRKAKQYAFRLRDKNVEILDKNKQLQADAAFKNKLLSIIAHDFRAPLANIIQLAAVNKDQPFDQDSMSMMLETISATSQNTLDLFENTLRWIKSQLPGFVYHPQNLLVQTLLEEAVESFRLDINTKQLNIVYETDPSLSLMADREMVQFVNRNLIHNAIKFSSRNEPITIQSVRKHNRIIVSIKNLGTPIKADQLEHIFEIQPGHQNTNRYNKGAGVALIICKDFIEMMNGEIHAAHDHETTTFSYELPVE